MTGSGGLNTITQPISGAGMSATLPSGMTEDQTTLGATTPAPGTFTSIALASANVVTQSSTTGTLANTGLSILAGSSGGTYTLTAPSGAGVFKYISKTSTSTSATSVVCSGATVGSTAGTTLNFTGASQGVSLVSTSTSQWAIVGVSTVTVS